MIRTARADSGSGRPAVAAPAGYDLLHTGTAHPGGFMTTVAAPQPLAGSRSRAGAFTIARAGARRDHVAGRRRDPRPRSGAQRAPPGRDHVHDPRDRATRMGRVRAAWQRGGSCARGRLDQPPPRSSAGSSPRRAASRLSAGSRTPSPQFADTTAAVFAAIGAGPTLAAVNGATPSRGSDRAFTGVADRRGRDRVRHGVGRQPHARARRGGHTHGTGGSGGAPLAPRSCRRRNTTRTSRSTCGVPGVTPAQRRAENRSRSR